MSDLDFKFLVELGEDVLFTLQTASSVLLFGIWCECFAAVFLR